ncbi:MAG TPA: F0F1 ATP synthase subunit delta [Candidatus Saccharimonadia bacterium]|nr:F0F1 ATP synthase subunit delta [Candidatus Saccharimonadia bacterium]
MASRFDVAGYVAEHLGADRRQTVQAAAAWLVDHGQSRGARYLARDVAGVLAAGGYVQARVVTARPLSAEARSHVEAYVKQATGVRELELETAIDPALIGGIIIETPGQALDASVKTKLARYVTAAGDRKEASV